MKTLRTITILTLLFAPVFAQQPGFLQPVRVAIRAPEDEVNEELAKAIRAELRGLGNVVIAEKRADFLLQFNAAPIVGDCNGYVVAVVVVEYETKRAGLQAFTAPTLEELARYLVKTANREDFKPWRQREVSKR